MKLNRLLSFVILVVMAFAMPAFAEEAFIRIGKVAVFDIQVEGMAFSPDVVRNATAILTSGVTASGAYVSVASSRIEEEIVRKKAESHADACDKRCQIELGQKLSADKILHSLFLKEGNRCSLNLDLYDLAGEIQEKSVMIYNVPCTESDLFVAVRQGGALLSGPSGSFRYEGAVRPSATETNVGGGTVSHGLNIDRGETIVNVQTDEMGLLFVETNPPNANLQINGESVGTSPYQGQLMVGRYVIVADLGAYYHPARQEIQLTPAGATVSLMLPPAFGSLTVTSEPAGAEVLIDDKPVGQTPYTDNRLLSGPHKVEVRRALYAPETRTVQVVDGQSIVESFVLTGDFGSIAVSSDPPGASVMLDGKKLNRGTPLAVKPVKAGTHVVTIDLPGYGKRVETVMVERGERALVDVKLDPKYGTLTVMSQGAQDRKPCRGPVKIDGAEVGTSPWKGQVLAVEHRVQVDCGGRSATRNVTVGHNENTTITMDVDLPGASAAVVQSSRQPVVPSETRQVDVQKTAKKDDKYAFLDARRTRVSFQA
ncbi:MAG TPA: PEGA domain-containing protein, partial [Myxococcota bacterium]|nr:PEGA domain-containing protein [Myxococcota bacterium]